MSWRCLDDVLKTSSKPLKDVLKMSWRCFCKASWRRLENVLKTPWRRLENFLKTPWRCRAKTNILVLTKTSWTSSEDVRLRRTYPSRRLQDVFIKTNVCWAATNQQWSYWLYTKHLIDMFPCFWIRRPSTFGKY